MGEDEPTVGSALAPSCIHPVGAKWESMPWPFGKVVTDADVENSGCGDSQTSKDTTMQTVLDSKSQGSVASVLTPPLFKSSMHDAALLASEAEFPRKAEEEAAESSMLSS